MEEKKHVWSWRWEMVKDTVWPLIALSWLMDGTTRLTITTDNLEASLTNALKEIQA
jgi:hypothetical protein